MIWKAGQFHSTRPGPGIKSPPRYLLVIQGNFLYSNTLRCSPLLLYLLYEFAKRAPCVHSPVTSSTRIFATIMADVEELGEVFRGLEEGDEALGAERGAEEITSKELFEEAEKTLQEDTKFEDLQVKDRANYKRGVKEGKTEAIDNIKKGKPAPKIPNIWKSALQFGKWVGIEVGKGAAFALGMAAVEKLFKKEANKTHSSTDNKRLEIVTAINKAEKSIKPMLDDWGLWLAQHQDNRDNYGSVKAEDFDVKRFQILQEKLGSLTVFRDNKVAPAMKKAVEAKDVASAKDLLQQYIQYIQKCLDVSQGIQADGYKLMVSDGLQNHHAEFEEVKKDLEEVQAKA